VKQVTSHPYFSGEIVWNELMVPELSMARFLGADRVEQAMSQQFPSWRTQKDQTQWLSMLIGAMEKFSRPEWRGRPVDRRQRRALRARLARPAMTCPAAHASRFRLPN
jgi:hypothetical protein